MAFNALEFIPKLLSGRSLRENEIVSFCMQEGATSDEVSTQILESLVMFKLIKKIGKGVYADKDYEAPAVQPSLEQSGNKRSRTEEILYPEGCNTTEKRIEYLLSPHAQILTRPKSITTCKTSPSVSGAVLRDALKASVEFTNTSIVPDSKNKKNTVAFVQNERKSGSFSVHHANGGGIRLAISGYFGPEAKHETKEHVFKTFEEFAAFVKGNL